MSELEPKPFRGWRRSLAIVWMAGVILLYLAVRELGVAVVP
jgi:hypothetical protein